MDTFGESDFTIYKAYNFSVGHNCTEPSMGSLPPESLEQLHKLLFPKMIILGILAVVVITTNGLLVFTIMFHKNLRTKANYFVVALSCADFSLGFPSIPLHCLAEAGVLGRTQSACLLVMCFTCAQIVLSVLMLFCLSLERYVKLVHPFGYAKHITERRVYICIATCAIYSITIGFLPIMGWNNVDTAQASVIDETNAYFPCKFELILSSHYLGVVFLGHIGPTFIVLPLLHFHIFLTAHRLLRRRTQFTFEETQQRPRSQSLVEYFRNRTNSNAHSPSLNSPGIGDSLQAFGYLPKTSRNYRHFKILVLVAGYFIFSWIPLVLWETILLQGFTKDNMTVQDVIETPIPLVFYYIALFLAVMNSAVNPILFGMGNLTTRTAFINTVLKCQRRNNNEENCPNSLVLIKDNVIFAKQIYQPCHSSDIKNE